MNHRKNCLNCGEWVLLVALAFYAVTCLTSAIPAPNLQELVTQSGTVAVGRITQIRDLGEGKTIVGGSEVSSRNYEADFVVEQKIKGLGGHLLHIDFQIPQTNVGYRATPEQQDRAVFLVPNGANYKYTNPYYPSVPAKPVQRLSATPLYSVLACMQAAIASPEVSSNQKREAIWILRFIRGERVDDVLRAGANESNIEVKLEAISTLLAHNDISFLPIATEHLKRPGSELLPETRQQLISAIYDGIKDQRAIPELNSLLKARDPKVRQAAAMALRNTGSRIAVGPLSAALDDSDELVRYFAVMGLAEITNQPNWRPLLPDFRANQSRYLDYWRDWAAAQRVD